MAQPNGFFVDFYGNVLKSGILIAPDGSIQFVSINSTGQQVISSGIGGSVSWGQILGSLTNQTDLQSALATLTTAASTAQSTANTAQTTANNAQTTATAAVPGFIAPLTEGSTVTLVPADNAGTSICPVNCVVTVNTGLGIGFGRSFQGPGVVSFTGTAALSDDRVSGATAPSCALICWATNTYHIVGTKA